jgi:ATP-dependent RNA helicase DDX46/PRP5
MAESFNRKRRDGTAATHGSGFGGSGFKFNTIEDGAKRKERKALALEYGGEQAAAALGSSSDEEGGADDDDEARPPPGGPAASTALAVQQAQASAQAAVAAFQAAAAAKLQALAPLQAGGGRAGFGPGALMPIAAYVPAAGPACPPPPSAAAAALQSATAIAATLAGANATPAARAAAFAATLNASRGFPGSSAGEHHTLEIEINDFPQHARWKVTHKDSLREITELTGAIISAKGAFVPPGRPVALGERKLFLLVEGTSERSVREAKVKIREALEAASQKEILPGAASGRYTV